MVSYRDFRRHIRVLKNHGDGDCTRISAVHAQLMARQVFASKQNLARGNCSPAVRF